MKLYEGLMLEAKVTVSIPESIYRRLKRLADLTYRPVEDILATTVDMALPTVPNLPTELADELAAMNMLSDDALLAMVRSALSSAQAYRLDQLSHVGGERPFTEAETREIGQLIDQHDRSVLRRAKAIAILAFRGHDIKRILAIDPLTNDNAQDSQASG